MKNKIYPMAGALCLAVVAASCCRQNPSADQTAETNAATNTETTVELKDYGKEPVVLDIESCTLSNEHFRIALWTGDNLQVTLMSIPAGGEVGLERHPNLDQFLRVEAGTARVMMGDSRELDDFVREASDDDAIFVPAGKWHNIVNAGDETLKIYSIYAPAEHPHGTVHRTQQEAMAAEAAHHH